MALGHLYQVSSACLLCRGAHTGELELELELIQFHLTQKPRARFGATECDGPSGVPVHCYLLPSSSEMFHVSPITLLSLMVDPLVLYHRTYLGFCCTEIFLS